MAGQHNATLGACRGYQSKGHAAPERGTELVVQARKEGGMDAQMEGIGHAIPAFSPFKEAAQSLSFQSAFLPHPVAVAHGDSRSPFPSSGCSAPSWGPLPVGDHPPVPAGHIMHPAPAVGGHLSSPCTA